MPHWPFDGVATSIKDVEITMRILLVGAGGVGAAIAKIASERSFFEVMVVADFDVKEPKKLSNGSGSATAMRLLPNSFQSK